MMKRIDLLDYGRLIAALAVMAFHHLFNGLNNGKVSSLDPVPAVVDFVKYGYLGVEFFFLISGYVIFFSARTRSAASFFVSRATRLVPAFVPAVLLTACFAVFWGGELMAVSWPQVLANMTFFPHAFGHEYVDGVYWTLKLEITFYAAVFMMLLTGQRDRLELVVMLWPAWILIAKLLGISWIPLAGNMFLFFAVGALFSILQTRRDAAAWSSLFVAMALAVAYSAARAEGFEVSKGVPYSGAVAGTIVLAMFAFFAALQFPRLASVRLPGSRLAGALTYPIYLLHAHIGYMLLSQFADESNRWVAHAAVAAFIILLAYGLHVVFERRLGPIWKGFFERIAAAGWRMFGALRPAA